MIAAYSALVTGVEKGRYMDFNTDLPGGYSKGFKRLIKDM